MTSSFPPPAATEFDSTSKLRASLNRLAATLPKPSVCEQAVHEAIKASKQAFESCKLIGVQTFPDGRVLILRNCACGSTMAKEAKDVTR